MIRVVIRIALVLCVLVNAARAEVVELPKTTATLTIGDEWKAIRATGVVVAYRSDAGGLLAVTRAEVPNPDAWRSEKKQAYADEVERGVKSAIPGYKRVSKKLLDANGIPALDVEAKREGGAIVVVRVLLFRTYALSLAIEVPKGGDVRAARAIARAFMPPKEPKT